MASTSVKVIGAVVVIVIIVAVIAAAVIVSDDDDSSDSSSSSSTENQVRYNYSIEFTDSFQDPEHSSITYSAGSGNTFAVVTFELANDGYGDGISNNTNYWKFVLRIDGVDYSHSSTMSWSWSGGYVSMTIPKGSTGSFVFLYTVPAGTTASDVTVVPGYRVLGTDPTFVYDPSL